LGDFDDVEGLGLGESFDTFARFDNVKALAALDVFEGDFLIPGRAGDRPAAARRCFGKFLPASLALDSSKRSRTGQATLAPDPEVTRLRSNDKSTTLLD
jgi:hypothetical protein